MSSATTDATVTMNWHGYLLADAGLPAPTCTVASDELSRPRYTNIKSAEYLDSPAVLEVKADVLLRMWLAAERPLIYAGAGISTSSGIQDYASNAKGSVVQAKKMPLTRATINALRPTLAHRTITAMEQAGLVWGWLQQNHDGLAQKAGFPAHKVNELHGSWLDSKANPIIKMSGSLRGDLFEWMLQMEDQCDFVFALGTSFSGLNADRCAETCAQRHLKRGTGQGLAMISIQQTQMDSRAALRIFAKIDDFMAIVVRKMGLDLQTAVHPYSAPALPVGPLSADVYSMERRTRFAAHKVAVAAKAAAAVVEAKPVQVRAAAVAAPAVTKLPSIAVVKKSAVTRSASAPRQVSKAA